MKQSHRRIGLTASLAMLAFASNVLAVSIDFDTNGVDTMSAEITDRFSTNDREQIQVSNSGSLVSFYGVDRQGRRFSCFVDSANRYVNLEEARDVANSYSNGRLVIVRKLSGSNECLRVIQAFTSTSIRALSNAQGSHASPVLVPSPIEPMPLPGPSIIIAE